jgi:hypothetical protein
MKSKEHNGRSTLNYLAIVFKFSRFNRILYSDDGDQLTCCQTAAPHVKAKFFQLFGNVTDVFAYASQDAARAATLIRHSVHNVSNCTYRTTKIMQSVERCA